MRPTGLPEPGYGYDAGHRYIYSTEEGDSCSCGWTPPGFRVKDPAEWRAHVDAAARSVSLPEPPKGHNE